MSAPPITYRPDFIGNHHTDLFHALWNGLPWERRNGAPRRECWMNDYALPYTYGKGAGERTYIGNPWNERVFDVKTAILFFYNHHFDSCFVNGYDGPRDHLGWHSDNSPEMDDARPVAVVSLGSARQIWFRPIGSKAEPEKLLLEPGSLLLMHPGMQDTHEHRIPKHGADCGARISLTFRGLIRE